MKDFFSKVKMCFALILRLKNNGNISWISFYRINTILVVFKHPKGLFENQKNIFGA